MSSCHLYQDGSDTAGNPIFKVKCFCGTTACQRINEFELRTCGHYWYKCEPETDDIEHCANCGAHRQPAPVERSISPELDQKEPATWPIDTKENKRIMP